MASDTGLANAAWEALFRAQMTIAAELHAGDAWGDLVPTDYGVLYALSTARTGLRMSELGKDILLSQAGLSRSVARLEARGLVNREADPAAARASILSLSKAGVHLQKRRPPPDSEPRPLVTHAGDATRFACARTFL